MRRLCVAWLMAVAATAFAQEAPNLLSNGGMEGDYQAGLPPGWILNCYGENTATFRADRETPHSGQAALLIECTDFATGGVQFHSAGQSVVQGQPYTLSLWMKGDLKGQVWVGVRKHGEPYTAYLLRYLRVGPEWRRYTIVGEAKGTDPDCGVYLMFAETGKLWVDDVSLQAGRFPPATAAIDRPPVKGNHVYNSSFSAGLTGWAPLGDDPSLEGPEACPDGQSCALRKLNGTGLILESRPMTLRAGQKHTLSAWLKSTEPHTEVLLELCEYADAGGDNPIDREGIRGEVEVGTTWERKSVTGIVEASFTDGYMVRLHALTPAREMRVDAVQVEEGDLSDYAPAAPVELAIQADVASRYVRPGTKVSSVIRVSAVKPFPTPPLLRVTLTDLWDQEVFRREKPCPELLNRTGASALTLEPVVPAPGIYRYRAELVGYSCSPGELVVAGMDGDAKPRPNPDSFFGTHAPIVLPPVGTNLGNFLAFEAGARWHRIHDFACYVQWHFVEPKPGEWVWADREVNALKERGWELLGTLARTPPWAGKQGPEHTVYGDWTSSPPRDLAEFSEYVRRTVTHYKDRIHVWEIWNEPYGSGFFSGTPEEYAEVLKAGYRACKEADPACIVLGLSCYPGLPEWIDRVLAAAGTENMDALSYHTYFDAGHVAERSDGGPPLLVRDLERLRDLMRKHGTVKPIWNTEGGVACPPSYSWLPPNGWSCTPREAAGTYTKCVALLLASDVKRWCYYFAGWPEGGRGEYYRLLNTPYVQLDFDGSPKATLLAQSAAARMLDGARFVSDASTSTVRAYLFQRGRDAVAVLWAKRDDQPVKLAPLTSPLRVLSMMAAPMAIRGSIAVTGEPVYVVAPGKPAAEMVTALGLKPE